MLKGGAAIQRALPAALASMLNVFGWGRKGAHEWKWKGLFSLPIFFLKEDSGFLPLLPLLWPLARFKAGRKSWNSWCPPFFLPPDLPVTMKLPQGPQARLRWQLCLLHHPQRFPQAPPQHRSLGWVALAGSPRSHTRASSAASSLPPAWHPSPFSLRSSI